MKKLALISACLFMACHTFGQTSITVTNTVAEQVLLGNYDPAAYKPSVVIDKPGDMAQGINDRVSPDSLYALMDRMQAFENRNTFGDTTSLTTGIGAARRWVYSVFEQYSVQNENRLIPAYLQFDQVDTRCNITAQLRNIMAVLPGSDTTDRSIVIIEGHIDSRCEDNCSDSCIAMGMEDNATGTALVMELARVMSKYSFKHTIVFLVTIGEEQGLHGARAFATYCQQKGIPVKGVQNNDVVGSIICGQTASPPGCMGAGTIDSTNLRIFSAGGFNSDDKQLARFTKLEYKENLLPIVNVPMTINIMTPIDRSGRGGDHQPFSDLNFTAIRFCAANEHGNADVTNPNYTDRQHTSGDILGVDTDNDQVIDSFFVNFNYLARMSVINGNTAAMMAIGPKTPDFQFSTPTGEAGFGVYITTQKQYQHYRVAVRTSTHDWDTVFTIQGADYGYFPTAKGTYFTSVASVDADGVESLFSDEKTVRVGITDTDVPEQPVELLQNHPNPFDGQTIISVLAGKDMSNAKAYISICDLAGKELKKIPIHLKQGMNEVTYEHGYNVVGTYVYTLVVNGQKIQSKRMVFAN